MGGTILLADDSLTIQKVIELTFAETDFEVVAVSSGEELLARLPAVKPNVIICDVIMPGKDGYDVCQEIKSNPAALHIPVILLTGTFEPFDRDRALAAGCSEIITKPFEARRLVETVERLLRDSHASAPAPARSAEPGAVVPPRYPGQVTPPPMTPPAMDYTGAVRPPAAPAPAFAPPATAPFDDGGLGAGEAEDDEFATRFTAPRTAATPPAPAAAEVFGQAVAAGEESLDFTTTGFAEMREASQRVNQSFGDVPDDGLDYDAEAPGEEPVPPWATAVDEVAPLGAIDRDTGPIPSLATYRDEPDPSAEPAPGAYGEEEGELGEATGELDEAPYAPAPAVFADEAEPADAVAASAEPWRDDELQPAALEPEPAADVDDHDDWAAPAEPAPADELEAGADEVAAAPSPWDTRDAGLDAGWEEPESEPEPAAEPAWAATVDDQGTPWSPAAPEEPQEEEPSWEGDAWSAPPPAPADEGAGAVEEPLDSEPRETWQEPLAPPVAADAWTAPEPPGPWGAARTPSRSALDTAEWDRGETWVDAPMPAEEEEPSAEHEEMPAASPYDAPVAAALDTPVDEPEPEAALSDNDVTAPYEPLDRPAEWRDDELEPAAEYDAGGAAPEVDAYDAAHDAEVDEVGVGSSEPPFDQPMAEPDDAYAAEAAPTPEDDAFTAAPVMATEAGWEDEGAPAAADEEAAELPPPGDELPQEMAEAIPEPLPDELHPDEMADETPDELAPEPVLAASAPLAMAAAAVPAPEPEAPARPAAVAPARLSDEDVDRIARRVLELSGDAIERIAWEVIPDMAEIVVRERVRALEERMESSDSVQ